MGPFQRLAINIFFQQTFFHHQAQIWTGATPWGIRALIEEVAQVIQTTGLLRASLLQPFFTRLAAFPRTRGKAKDFNLYIAPLKRACQNIRANRRNRNGAPPHGPRIVQQQGNNRVAELRVLFHFEAKRRGWICNDTRQTARVQNTLFQIEQPTAVLLRLQTTLQFVGQTANSPLERFKLLIQIGAKTFQFDGFCQLFGVNLFVVVCVVNGIVWISIRNGLRWRRIKWCIPLWHLHFVGHVVICTVILADLCFCGVLLLFLGLFWIGLCLILLAVVIPCAVGILILVLILLRLILLILIRHIRVITQLIAIPQIADDLAGKFCKLPLI